MPLKLRPTGLGSGIDKDRPDKGGSGKVDGVAGGAVKGALGGGRPAAQSAWAKSIEKVNNKQAELKQRAAAATTGLRWSRSSASASNSKQWQREPRHWQGTVEKLRSRHTGLPVRMADSEFDRVWYGHCPDEAAPKPVAWDLTTKDDGAYLRVHPQECSVLYPNDREGPSPQSLASSITASIISKALACDWL